MELPSELFEQIAFTTGPKIEENMMVVLDKSIHEEHFSQTIQTNTKIFKKVNTFLSSYIGIFNVTHPKKNEIRFAKSISDKDGFFQKTIPPGAYGLESLNDEIKRSNFEEGHFTEVDYLFTTKANISTLASIIKISRQEALISFIPDDGLRDSLGINANTIYEEYNLSPNRVDISSVNNIFIETVVAQGMIIKGKRSGIIHNFTMDEDPGYKYIGKFRGGLSWYMKESNDFISNISFRIKNENGKLISLNGQSNTFSLSNKEV